MWSLHTDAGNSIHGGQYAKNVYLGETRIVTKLCLRNDPRADAEELQQYFYHSDHLGSASLISDYKGDEYQRIEYTPYGETWIERTDNKGLAYLPYKFTAKELDSETGLYYYGARYLDSKYSTWISTDPALGDYIPQAPISDEARKHNQNLPGMGGIFNHINCNLYAYGANNPVRYIDPDGNDNKVAIVGNDTRWGYRKTFYEAAKATGNRIISTHIIITIKGIGNYGAVSSGQEAIAALRAAGSKANPITDIYFSTHGTPYAIDFYNSGNNLYVDNMSDYNKDFKAGGEAAFISDLVKLVEEGIIAPDVHITLGGCRNGALPDNAADSNDPTTILWAKSKNPTNIAQALSKALPQATITANRTQVNASKGLNEPVTYRNGLEVNND